MTHSFFRRAVVLNVILLGLACLNPNGIEANADDFDPLAQKGTLQDAAKPLGELLKLEWSGGGLDLKRRNTNEEFRLFNLVANAAGRNGGSGSSSGSTRMSRNFRRTNMHGEIVLTMEKGLLNGFNNRNSVWPSFRATFREIGKPNRTLIVNQNNKGKLEIEVQSDQTQYRFRFRQKEDGTFLVQELRPGGVFAKSESSFLLFCCKNREYVDKKLLPLLSHFGMPMPGTALNPELQAAVIARLRPLSRIESDEFQSLLQQLGDDSFAARRTATRNLASRYKVFQHLIRDAATDETNSKESRNRLLQIVKSEGGDKAKKTLEFLDKSKIHHNPVYLVAVLEQLTDTADREVIVKTLEEKTKQSFGNNLAAWKNWLHSIETPNKKTIVPTSELFKDIGLLQNLSTQMGTILKFSIQKKNLQIHREHWAKPFGGKTIAELEKEIAGEIAKRGLPADWYYQRHRGANHVQVLFHKLCKSANLYANTRSSNAENIVMEANNQQIQARMEFSHKQSEKPSSGTIRLFVREQKGSRNSFEVVEQSDGKLSITFQRSSDDFLLRFSQQADGGVVADGLHGEQSFSAIANSFQEFLTKHDAIATESLLPLMKKFGMLIPAGTLKKSKPQTSSGKASKR